uniref:Uncharacterized protein n=1 Tax=Cacopsylla melanoneura TaxID=428564 RepID=A0A8D8R7J4_9HEMI
MFFSLSPSPSAIFSLFSHKFFFKHLTLSFSFSPFLIFSPSLTSLSPYLVPPLIPTIIPTPTQNSLSSWQLMYLIPTTSPLSEIFLPPSSPAPPSLLLYNNII